MDGLGGGLWHFWEELGPTPTPLFLPSSEVPLPKLSNPQLLFPHQSCASPGEEATRARCRWLWLPWASVSGVLASHPAQLTSTGSSYVSFYSMHRAVLCLSVVLGSHTPEPLSWIVL